MQLRNALQRLVPRQRASTTGRTQRRAFPRASILAFLTILGPGLVSAIAGDDAGGIGTYSQVGAKYGYQQLWALVIVIFTLIVVQEIAARLTIISGKGLADLIREQFGVRTTAFAMLTLFIANGAVTISEFVGIAAASELFGVNRYFSVPLAAIAVWWIVARGNYRVAEKIFLALSAVLVVYVISAIAVHPDWAQVARGTFIPTLQPDPEYILLTIAVIGTTISPYMQFTLSATTLDKGTKPEEYGYVFLETIIGVLLSGAFAFFIVVATGATLHINGITNIESADQAAQALAPIAGPLAEVLFGVGLLGASLLAASILPLSTTYAICEAFGWERGVNQEWQDARIFYALYTALIVIGAVVALIPGLPLFQIFVYVYLLNGILLPVLLILMLRLANNKRLMGKYVNSLFVNILGWGITIVLIVLTAALVISTIFGV
ncbi:MAG TPA: Nramp family divalent metal transporter [Anaerolineae bacterium]|nr:Nramp family divalent metal transporter [Anaerolineae bacterium]